MFWTRFVMVGRRWVEIPSCDEPFTSAYPVVRRQRGRRPARTPRQNSAVDEDLHWFKIVVSRHTFLFGVKDVQFSPIVSSLDGAEVGQLRRFFRKVQSDPQGLSGVRHAETVGFRRNLPLSKIVAPLTSSILRHGWRILRL